MSSWSKAICMESKLYIFLLDSIEFYLYEIYLADPHLTISAKNMDETIDSKELKKFANASHFLT